MAIGVGPIAAHLGTPAHHATHRRLLRRVEAQDAPGAGLDAIIVPCRRSPFHLHRALAAARHMDTTVLFVCSGGVRASDAALAAKRAGVRARAVDMDPVRRLGLLPDSAGSVLLRRTRSHRRTDVSLKRNLGLLVAEIAGWERVLFLDDDIALPRPQDLQAAAGLLEYYAAVGLANTGMPDNSVVCHANRESGGAQDTFVGGGALAIRRSTFRSFFPDIYNEDWFFLLDDSGLVPTAVTGAAHQADYDPFHSPHQARSQELGDTLAEGLYALLDEEHAIAEATELYWEKFLLRRRAFIRATAEQVRAAPDLPPDRRKRMTAALRAALIRSRTITADLCTGYLSTWRGDRDDWRARLDGLGRRRASAAGVDYALWKLGLAEIAQRA